MNISQLSRLIDHCYRVGQLGEEQGINRYLALLVWGEAGIGKSESVFASSKRLEVGFIDLRTSLMEAPDLIGLPERQEVYPCPYDWLKPNPNPELLGLRFSRQALLRYVQQFHRDQVVEGDPAKTLDRVLILAQNNQFRHLVETRTVFSPPSWFPQPGTRGILFLDEINRSPRDVRQALFQLVLDRRMHELFLPPGWIVLAAANPSKDSADDGPGYQVEELDKAFLDRFCHVALVPDPQEWLAHTRSWIHPSLWEMVAADKSMLGINPCEIPDVKPTPRSIVMLNKLMSDKVPIDHDILTEAAIGIIGVAATRFWLRLRQVPDRPVKWDEVLADYSAVRSRLVKFTRYPIQKVDEEGNPVTDESGNPVTETTYQNEMFMITLEDMFGSMMARQKEGKPYTREENANMLAFWLDMIRPTGDGGLGAQSLTYQYMKWVARLPGFAPIASHPAIQAHLQTLMKEAGTGKGEGGGLARRAQLETFGSIASFTPASATQGPALAQRVSGTVRAPAELWRG